MKVVYKVNDSIEASELSDVFKKAGLKRPVHDLPRLEKMIQQADLLLTARVEGQVIGVARAITDFHYCCYLSDLAVNKDYQSMGVGKELIRILQEEIGDDVSLLLLSSQEAMTYYPKIGFTKVDNGFVIPRKNSF
ncbi:GNAT family N-acetyltransferase [Metabacillus sp. HB246100]|uniref:GNAT family N-acetyltransferase n=1 Tax=Bacillus weihaiensis TaxID=1547283 RepID=UPI00235232BB|nr:GNAT family N-acetyltransferase [Bacillus weihaiensis]